MTDGPRRLADELAYPPRLMRADRAAAYVGMSTSQFLKMVREHEMPQAIRIHSMTLWDRLELDSAVDDWKARQEPRRRNMVDVALGIDTDGDRSS
jgi:predicted DNA-binding transcriptional regulator AlpA